MKSNKTTVAGAIVGLALILHATVVLFDGDPETTFKLTEATTFIGGAGTILLGLFARDYNVTSEGTQAPKTVK
tara:strand:- start:4313 stop:4531 length:219 start_codon:yes stop_codon:yes gene_type:complete